MDGLWKAATFLQGWGLVGISVERPETFGTEDEHFLYLPALGENYMRVLEARLAEQGALAVGKRLSLGVARELWDTGKQAVAAAAGTVSAQYAGVRP